MNIHSTTIVYSSPSSAFHGEAIALLATLGKLSLEYSTLPLPKRLSQLSEGMNFYRYVNRLLGENYIAAHPAFSAEMVIAHCKKVHSVGSEEAFEYLIAS